MGTRSGPLRPKPEPPMRPGPQTKTPESRRPQVSDDFIAKALKSTHSKLLYRLREKGRGTQSSRHEILGILTEEMHELERAVEQSGLEQVRKELLDIAVGAIFGVACLDAGTID